MSFSYRISSWFASVFRLPKLSSTESYGEGHSYLSGFNVNHDGVVHLNQGIWVADVTSVVGRNVWNRVGPELSALHLAQLVLGLLCSYSVKLETSLHIVQKTEDLVGTFNLNDICLDFRQSNRRL